MSETKTQAVMLIRSVDGALSVGFRPDFTIEVANEVADQFDVIESDLDTITSVRDWLDYIIKTGVAR